MVQKYQNEIAPIFYYGISTKPNEKDLKIHILQPPDWKHPYWMTLYIQLFPIFSRQPNSNPNPGLDPKLEAFLAEIGLDNTDIKEK